MNTTLTPLAASIERAQAALDRKAAKLGELADRAPELPSGWGFILHRAGSSFFVPAPQAGGAS